MKLLYIYIALLGANVALAMEPEVQPAVDLEHPSSALLELPDELLMPILQDTIITIIADSTTLEDAMEKINKLASVNSRFDKIVHDEQMVAFINKKLQPKIKDAKEWIKKTFNQLGVITTNDTDRIAKLLTIPAIAKYITREYRGLGGWTALMTAASFGYTQIVELLLNAKANPNIYAKGMTALIVAALHGHTKVVKMLLDAHANPNIPDSDGWTALMIAARDAHLQIAQMLLDANANPNIQNLRNRWTALVFAAANGRSQIVQILLENGANPNMQDNVGRTALIIAIENRQFDTARIIENYSKEHPKKESL